MRDARFVPASVCTCVCEFGKDTRDVGDNRSSILYVTSVAPAWMVFMRKTCARATGCAWWTNCRLYAKRPDVMQAEINGQCRR